MEDLSTHWVAAPHSVISDLTLVFLCLPFSNPELLFVFPSLSFSCFVLIADGAV